MSKSNTCECGHARAEHYAYDNGQTNVFSWCRVRSCECRHFEPRQGPVVDAETLHQALVLIGETLSLVYEKLGSYEERDWTCAVNERLHKLKALTDRMEKP
jgi:hypothetical protein